jgi:hypothetical protein
LPAFFFFFAVFLLAFGRDFFAAFFFFFAAFLFLAFGFAAGAIGSRLIGVGAGTGAGDGAEGNIGSEKPGPGQLLSA